MSAISHIILIPATLHSYTQTVLDWVFGGAVLACIAGVIIAAAKLAFAPSDPGPQQVTRWMWVVLGCAVLGSASAIAAIFA